MLPNPKTRANVKFSLFLAFVGLALVVTLVAFPPLVSANFSWRKPLIGSIFSAFCLLGVLAVFSPQKCGKLLDTKSKTDGSHSETLAFQDSSVVFQGHHPTCGKYTAHVFQIKNKTCCSACVGLLFGGVLALVTSVVYFFGGWTFTEYSVILVVLGVVGTVFGLFQFVFNSLVRLFANTVFVVSTLLILIGVDAAVQNLFFDLFVVCLVVFWLFTRISFSQWDHERICFDCETENCAART